jgi:hypothetical protein
VAAIGKLQSHCAELASLEQKLKQR